MGRRFLSVTAALALLITVLFVLDPGPYRMFAFAFVALPLFAVGIAVYVRLVLRELRAREVL